MAELTPPAPVTLREFDEIFERSRTGAAGAPTTSSARSTTSPRTRCGPRPRLVRSGRRATMAIPMNTVAGPDNPSPVIHHVVQGHDIDIGSSTLTFATDFLGPGLPRRLPHPHGRAVPHRLQGPGLQRQAGPGGHDLAGAPPRWT